MSNNSRKRKNENDENGDYDMTFLFDSLSIEDDKEVHPNKRQNKTNVTNVTNVTNANEKIEVPEYKIRNLGKQKVNQNKEMNVLSPTDPHLRRGLFAMIHQRRIDQEKQLAEKGIEEELTSGNSEPILNSSKPFLITNRSRKRSMSDLDGGNRWNKRNKKSIKRFRRKKRSIKGKKKHRKKI